MRGTEKDIYDGLQELCENHYYNNILFTFVVFNEEVKVLYEDEPISVIIPQVVEPDGLTNLNGALYQTFQKYKYLDQTSNLFVTISDGDDNINQRNNINRVSEVQVAS